MYEENLRPLPSGDATAVFGESLVAIQQEFARDRPSAITPDNVVQWARRDIQRAVSRICRRLLLPGSGISGIESLAELNQLAADGSSCIVCLNHRCNLDVPTLLVLLQDLGRAELFEPIVWIAGRKLNEDVGLTPVLIQAVNRVVITPRSWMRNDHSEEESREAHQLNIAALRAIHQLRHEGHVFGLFPAGTRFRPGDSSTRRAIEETDSYLKSFDYLLLARIDGCTLPVAKSRDFTHETPTLDCMTYTFGPVLRTQEWRDSAAERFAELDQRTASARAIMRDIDEL